MSLTPPDEEENAFSFDEDEDMNALLEEAARAGSAATEDEGENFDSSSLGAPKVMSESEIVPVTDNSVQENSTPSDSDFDSLFKEATAMVDDATVAPEISSVVEAPVAEPEPTPAEVVNESPAEVAKPVAKNLVVNRPSEAELIANAKAIIDTIDAFRELPATTRGVVAQLISQDSEASLDEATIAIKAIYADELIFSTTAALKEAKSHTPVDRAFFILGLNPDVRENLGNLTVAFADKSVLTGETSSLEYAKSLVNAIDALDTDAIGYVTATESVLRAAKQR